MESEQKPQDEKKKKQGAVSTFFKKNATIMKQNLLQAVGKSEKIVYPDHYKEENGMFKVSLNHYKDIEKISKRLIKLSGGLESEESELGELLRKFSESMEEEKEIRSQEEIDDESHRYSSSSLFDKNATPTAANPTSAGSYFAGTNSLQDELLELDARQNFKRTEERDKVNRTFVQELDEIVDTVQDFGECLSSLAALRSELNQKVSEIFLEHVSGLTEDMDDSKEVKESYRDALVTYQMKKTNLKNLKLKSNDLLKIKNAETDYVEAKKRSELEYEDIMDEFEYNFHKRNHDYVDALRDFISAYRTYFVAGAELLKDLEGKLKHPADSLPELKQRKPRRYVRTTEKKTSAKDKDLTAATSQQFQNKTIYGTDLSQIMAREDQTDDIPHFLRSLIQTIEKNGIDHEGIFRLAGDATEVALLKKKLDKGIDIDVSKPKDVNNAAALLKAFVRELPDPLLQFEHYEKFMTAITITDSRAKVDTFKSLLAQLPPCNQLVLDAIFELLTKIAANSQENKMHYSNLAIVFGMNILHPKDMDNPLRLANDSKKMNDCCCFLLENYEEHFKPILQTKKGKLKSGGNLLKSSGSFSSSPSSATSSTASTTSTTSIYPPVNNRLSSRLSSSPLSNHTTSTTTTTTAARTLPQSPAPSATAPTHTAPMISPRTSSAAPKDTSSAPKKLPPPPPAKKQLPTPNSTTHAPIYPNPHSGIPPASPGAGSHNLRTTNKKEELEDLANEFFS